MPSRLVIDLSIYPDEAALLDGLRRHERHACTCLIKRLAPLVYSCALGILGDHDDAETVVQTTFIKACAALDDFRGDSSIASWIYRIATNEALMLHRRRRPHVSLAVLADAAAPDDPLRAVLSVELRELLVHALAQLPANLRMVVQLRDIDSLSTEETAARLGITPGAVKVRLHRARARLRTILQQVGYGR
jgi:RNA polymerase sigma-70 factor (ECF subfamily)